MAGKTITVGLISDTHGLLRPQALDALAGSDYIVHAGDIGDPDILEALARIAPVTAVRGNNDAGPAWAVRVPERAVLRAGAIEIHVLHDIADLKGTPPVGARVVITGHSHKPAQSEKDGVLYVNPGSAGPRRFTLPIAVGRLHIRGTQVEAQLQQLAL